MSTTIEWVETAVEQPDAEEAVLMALENGEVWIGFVGDEGEWRNICAARLPKSPVYWAHLPEAPL